MDKILLNDVLKVKNDFWEGRNPEIIGLVSGVYTDSKVYFMNFINGIDRLPTVFNGFYIKENDIIENFGNIKVFKDKYPEYFL